MAEGKQKRIDPDLVDEVNQYNGRNFTEKLLNWKRDVDNVSHDFSFEDIETVVSSQADRVIRELGNF